MLYGSCSRTLECHTLGFSLKRYRPVDHLPPLDSSGSLWDVDRGILHASFLGRVSGFCRQDSFVAHAKAMFIISLCCYFRVRIFYH